jgi:hypothetical protein
LALDGAGQGEGGELGGSSQQALTVGRLVMPLLRSSILFLAFAIASTTAFAGDQEDLVGRWDQVVNEALYIRFQNDGTFKEVALLASVEGKYRVIQRSVLEIRTPGVLYGENTAELKYKLDGDNLEIFNGAAWVKYKRVR